MPKLFELLKSGIPFIDLKADFIAGLTVAVIALPLSMALGIASGAGPQQGLITAIIAGFLISFLGGSRVQIGGPTGAFVVVIFSVIANHGYDGLLLATAMAGFLLIGAGLAKFGRILKYIPHSVITGFTTGIAVIIASTQVKDFFGLPIGSVLTDFFDNVESSALAIGVLTFGTILICRRFAPKLPGYLIALVAATVLAGALGLSIDTVGSRFPHIETGIPFPSFPDFSYEKALEVLPSAFIIAFLAGIEALLSAVIADGMTGYTHKPNQELIGQGVANLTSACFGGLPATGALARTAANISAGGKTPFAGMFHAFFLLLFALFASGLMQFVPMAALAGVLLSVAWGMSESHRFYSTIMDRSQDSILMLLTFFLTIMIDLTVAIAVGVILAYILKPRSQHVSEQK